VPSAPWLIFAPWLFLSRRQKGYIAPWLIFAPWLFLSRRQKGYIYAIKVAIRIIMYTLWQ
jgi:hypothetical protein